MITGITRVRNESLILEDTLKHFLQYCDRIWVYDDCSTDNTVDIAKSFDRVEVIPGDEWKADRVAENTRHRKILLDKVDSEWCLCFDADERLVGEIPNLSPNGPDGYKFRLFDGYLTKDYQDLYEGGDLATLPRMWGPEFRDITMLFRTTKAKYNKPGMREPIVDGKVVLANMYVKHFGKCLSIDHWEDTCSYYADNFPEPFRSKWQERKGKAIHTKSDFGKPLYRWEEVAKHGCHMS